MNELKTPDAKISPALLAAQQLVRGHHLTADSPNIYGFVFRLRTLEPFEEDEAASLISAGTIAESGNKLRKALLAVALVAVNGEPIEQAFAKPENMDPQVAKVLEGAIEKDWRRREIIKFLDRTQIEVVDGAWEAYVDLVLRKKAALEAIRPLARGDTGTLSPTS